MKYSHINFSRWFYNPNMPTILVDIILLKSAGFSANVQSLNFFKKLPDCI